MTRGGLYVAKGRPGMAATNSLGGPKFQLRTVQGGNVFYHRQSRGTIFWGDQMEHDRPQASPSVNKSLNYLAMVL